MSNIQLLEIQKKRGNLVVSANDVIFQRGYIYSIYGRNGSGKSSLLKMISGVLKPDVGKLSGLDRTAYLPSDSNLLNRFSRRHLVQNFRLFNSGFDERKFNDLLFEFKLSGFDNTVELSKGERKCVFLSLCLATNPRTLILDEPLNGVDSINKQVFLRLLQDFVMDGENTVIMALNQLEDVIDLCDFFVQIDNGKVKSPQSGVDLQEKYSIINVDKDSISNHKDNYIAKERTVSGYRLLVEKKDHIVTQLNDILEMLGGI